MHLARHSITSTTPVNVIDVRFDANCDIFAAATPSGFGVYKTWPLKLVRKRGKDRLQLRTSCTLAVLWKATQ